jgi:branched-chain amino acid transport system substrate-binding protein
MPKLKILVLLMLVLALGAVGHAPACFAADPGDIKIGMNVSVTGPSAAQGALFIKAIRLAEKQVNQAGGVNGRKIQVVLLDNQSTNPGSLAALNRGVEVEKVVAVIGPVMSTQILAISDAVKSFAVPNLIGGTAVALTRQGNPWLFRVRPDDSLSAAAMVRYIKEDLKFTKVGILHDSDAFGSGGADLVEKGAKEAGLLIVRRDKFTTGTKDFTAQLLGLKSAGAEVMVMYSPHPEDAAVLQRQYRQLGSPFKYIGSTGSAAKDALALSREASEGIMAVVDYVPGASDVTKKYAEDYRKEYAADMDSLAAWNYDALNLLVGVMQKVGEDRAKIREALLATQGYQGVLGTFSFSPNGDGLHQVSVIRVEKGEHKLLKVINLGLNP